MPARTVGNEKIMALIKAGVIPHNCSNWEMRAPVDGVVTFHADVYATEEQFEKLADLLLADPAQCREYALEICFKGSSLWRSENLSLEMDLKKGE